jgi:hypothetical protein
MSNCPRQEPQLIFATPYLAVFEVKARARPIFKLALGAKVHTDQVRRQESAEIAALAYTYRDEFIKMAKNNKLVDISILLIESKFNTNSSLKVSGFNAASLLLCCRRVLLDNRENAISLARVHWET